MWATVVIEEEQPGDVCNDTDERPPGEHVGKRTKPDAGEKTQACKAGGQRRAVALPPRSVGPSPDRQPPRAFELVQRPGGGVGLGGGLLFFFLARIGKRQLCLAVGAQHGEKGVREHTERDVYVIRNRSGANYSRITYIIRTVTKEHSE